MSLQATATVPPNKAPSDCRLQSGLGQAQCSLYYYCHVTEHKNGKIAVVVNERQQKYEPVLRLMLCTSVSTEGGSMLIPPRPAKFLNYSTF